MSQDTENDTSGASWKIHDSDFPGRVILDPLGFPMIWVRGLQAHVHWLPMTCIQFELFLARGGADELDPDWYAKRYTHKQRPSAGEVTKDNFWGCLLTGIRPEEAQTMANWMGPEFRLPSSSEWMRLLHAAERAQALPLDWPSLAPTASSRCHELLRAFAELPVIELPPEAGNGRGTGSKSPRTLADQMLLRGGLMEWVSTELPAHPWGGLGEVHATLHRSISPLHHGEVRIPCKPLHDRIDYFGFRLIREAPVNLDSPSASGQQREDAS